MACLISWYTLSVRAVCGIPVRMGCFGPGKDVLAARWPRYTEWLFKVIGGAVLECLDRYLFVAACHDDNENGGLNIPDLLHTSMPDMSGSWAFGSNTSAAFPLLMVRIRRQGCCCRCGITLSDINRSCLGFLRHSLSFLFIFWRQITSGAGF